MAIPTSWTLPASADTDRSVAPVLATSTPVSISIPAIRVKTALLQLGLEPDGSLQVPPHGPHYGEAGWYRYSPTPGSVGPSVIVGHVDSAHDGPSVFYRLGSLRAGDTVEVTLADGAVAVFSVDKVVRYHKAEFPTALVYGNTDYPALRLITCGGPIDRRTGHYRDNTVVFATMIRASAATLPAGRSAAG